MSIIDWFNKKQTKKEVNNNRLDIPGDLWVKCFKCNDTLYLKDLEKNCKVCTCSSQYHFRITPEERINMHFDRHSFEEIEAEIEAIDFLEFEDTEKYKTRLKRPKKKQSMLMQF